MYFKSKSLKMCFLRFVDQIKKICVKQESLEYACLIPTS